MIKEQTYLYMKVARVEEDDEYFYIYPEMEVSEELSMNG